MWKVEREDETGTSPRENHEMRLQQSFQGPVQNACHDGDGVLVQAEANLDHPCTPSMSAPCWVDIFENLRYIPPQCFDAVST
jgi:hypothetical protein